MRHTNHYQLQSLYINRPKLIFFPFFLFWTDWVKSQTWYKFQIVTLLDSIRDRHMRSCVQSIYELSQTISSGRWLERNGLIVDMNISFLISKHWIGLGYVEICKCLGSEDPCPSSWRPDGYYFKFFETPQDYFFPSELFKWVLSTQHNY